MNIGDLSISCSLPQFLSSRVYSFHCRGPSHLWLRLFLVFFFFWGYCNWKCFTIFFINLFIVDK
jgi:hypothetical protein